MTNRVDASELAALEADPPEVAPGAKTCGWRRFTALAPVWLGIPPDERPAVKFYAAHRFPDRDAFYDHRSNTCWIDDALDGDRLIEVVGHELEHARAWKTSGDRSEGRAAIGGRWLLARWQEHQKLHREGGMDALAVAAKVRQIEEMFAEAGPTRDLRLVKRFGGDARRTLANLRLKNNELEAMADEFERTPDPNRLRALFGAGVEAPLGDYHRLRVESPPKMAPLRGGL